MKYATIKVCAALIALALLVVPALAVSTIDLPSRELQVSTQITGAPSHDQQGSSRIGMWLSLMVLAGTTITYLYPVSNTTTAPTAVQASQGPSVVAQVVFADADTTAAITHNLGVATAAGFAGGQPNIAQGFPEVICSWVATSTVVATIGYTNTSGNVVTLAKASLLGTAGTLFVTIRKPHTLSL